MAVALALPFGIGASPTARAADRDCSDFDNQAAAQHYFIDRGGPGSDPDRLDGDGDGVACDSLPCPCSSARGDGGQPQPERARTIRARVVSVTDGDTIKVRYRRRRRNVRVIGIDTPETKRPGVGIECGGPQASAKMQRLAPRGARIMLRTDPTQGTIDRYGRLLAYVGRAGRDLGRAQIAAGWATTYVYANNPFRRTADYRRSERRARRLGRGVHGLCGGDFHSEQAGGSSG
ncbi:MAG: thermonuclease family protein [Actinomycetota bacterium]|nr:thermonuclease family protein [Actinomycetota bacterium]